MVVQEYDSMIRWIASRIQLPGYSLEMWGQDHDEKCYEFVSAENKYGHLIARIEDSRLVVDLGPIVRGDGPLYYFLRPMDGKLNLQDVQHGTLSRAGSPEVLLSLASRVFSPQLVAIKSWPESVKKDVMGQFHKFMASLTETAYAKRLYLPNDLDTADSFSASKNKNLVQELEAIVIGWTRQIKDVVNSHDNNAEVPLEEIQFWRERTVDLSGVSEQLRRDDVRRVVAVLEASKSSYLARFQGLVKKTSENSLEAADNLKFLECLSEPCRALAEAEPKAICDILPELLGYIRMIWSLSKYYNTPERVTGLLRKISNEIIRRCCTKVDLANIFYYDQEVVENAMVSLEESIRCGVLWKRIFRKTAAAIAVSSSRQEKKKEDWSAFDDAAIFAQIDAFVQRCRDLIEVCEGQLQFCPVPPRFGGTRGHEIAKALMDIRSQFEAHAERLRSLDYDILDVKTSRWHDDYSVFKNAVKDLEVMYTNVMQAAFEGVSRVSEFVALLEIFHGLAKRDAIQRCVEKKTADAYALFAKTVEEVRRDFDENRRDPELRGNEPKWAGSALWAKALAKNVDDSWVLLKKSNSRPPREADEAEAAYKQLVAVLNDYKASRYKGWVDSLTSRLESAAECLNSPLMKRGSEQGGLLLECNFDHRLLSLFAEVQYWEKFQGEFSIPYVAHDVCNRREKLRVMREHVMRVVRAYNAILLDLSSDQRRLFSDVLKKLDKRINQGLNKKLTWATKGVVEVYVRDCCAQCADIHAVVKRFKESKVHVTRQCKQIAELSLIKIDKNVVYDQQTFEAKQAEHRAAVKKTFQTAHAAITKALAEMKAHFDQETSSSPPPEVQREWKELVRQIDRQVERALRHTVKKSLQELSRSINGDVKTEPQTLFGVKIVLLDDKEVDYRPTMVNLIHVVNVVAKELISTVAVVPRLLSDHETTETYYSVISNDEEMLKIVVQIMDGMSKTATELQKYLRYWETYKALWEMDKEAYMRRYAKANRSISNYHDDVAKYRGIASNIAKEDMTRLVSFVMLDCGLLKETLIKHCRSWQQEILGLLNQNARQSLTFLHDHFRTNTLKLTTPPSTLAELSEKLGVLDQVREDAPSLESKIPPIDEMYATLEKFEVQIRAEEIAQLSNLRGAYKQFLEMLDDAKHSLDRTKVEMRRDLDRSVESHSQQIRQLGEQIAVDLPVSPDLVNATEAMEALAALKKRVQALHDRGSQLEAGLKIFSVGMEQYQELKDAENQIRLAEEIWTVSKDWEVQFDAWKVRPFSTLDIESMEAVAAGQFNKQLGKLGREIKSWGIWEQSKNRLDEFLRTLPLVQDLSNPSLRKRHWDHLKNELSTQFDETSPEFTLESLFQTGLNKVPDLVSELSANANKEFAIEESLKDIESRWASVGLEICAYKNSYKVKSTEDLFQTLEDDSVQLSTMKASKFYPAFKDKVDRWEKSLGLVSEVTDVLLTVQRKWLYLESIFVGSDDIARQLPRESRLFDQVNKAFTETMKRANSSPNAVELCDSALLSQTAEMDDKLEAIQKSLDTFLESKRMVFPRFYFVSDDDLLAVIGLSRDPLGVQKHVKKLFEGFKEFEYVSPNKNRSTYEAIGMKETGTNETAPFVANVPLDGPVENWLVALEKAMVASMQKLLSASLVSFKGKKEKWIADVQGQLLITTGAIQWTNDCAKALNSISNNGQKTAMKSLKKKQVTYLTKLTEMIRGQLAKLVRTKLVALITMEIHNRDVIERMIKAGCSSVTDFEWLSQLRFIFDKDPNSNDGGGICSVRQTNCVLDYGYEYQGNNGRLVVTPLTDRCVLTLLTAKFLNRGGNPLGPAGTGKTETVKDLGKNLAVYVVVINCSDGMDYKSVGRIFSGLCQAGAWGCFDEFNRIKIEVISVVAMQVLSIVEALSRKAESFSFMGQQIKCNSNCGLFITMNPGYAGRTELPDNLKALMRPVAMMVPDLAMIAEVMLSAEGFNDARALSKKTITLYSLMQQQLSKQDHYDYGLRNLKAVLNMAGALKRGNGSDSPNEELILMRALRDMNLPKFIKDDERLFRLLLGDLFPSLELPVSSNEELNKAVRDELVKNGLQPHPFLLFKIGQLFDSQQTRHCNMMVGKTMSGKTTAWKTLAAAMKVSQQKKNVTPYVINAKSVTLTELYGAYDLQTFEWTDGILSTIFKSCAESEKQNAAYWIVFDGPVDAMWIESMNSVMDDNRILTLINGDRIPLTQAMSLVFEVEDLRVASPATVSRAGMIFLDSKEMGYAPFVESWLDRLFAKDNEAKAYHRELFDKYVPSILLARTKCNEPIPIADFNAVVSLTRFYQALYLENKVVSAESTREKWFVFAVTWTLGASVDEIGRKTLDAALRDIDETVMPPKSIYDYYVDPKKGEFELWESTLSTWRPAKGEDFFKMIVPTTDSTRHSFVFDAVVRSKHHLLVTGQTGVGKTVQCESLMKGLNPETHGCLTINFSATTKSSTIQAIFEGAMEKRSKDKFGPAGGKQLVVLCDDMNMPSKTSAESPFQPPLELVRLWLDYGGWYERAKCSWRYILDTQLVAAMAPGREAICSRLQSRFHLVNATTPNDTQLTRIFESILTPKLQDFDNEVKPMSKTLAIATISVYQQSIETFLPTPEKSIYLFNLRDVAKVVQGLLRADRHSVDSSQAMWRLWAHECLRVFADRFLESSSGESSSSGDGDDLGKFVELLDSTMQERETSWDAVMAELPHSSLPVACSFVSDKYEEVVDFALLKQTCEEKLEDYNLEPKLVNMELVLFEDAVRHITKIHRILTMPRGNTMLIGVGGSGRQSLARLSSYIAGLDVFTIEISKQYRMIEWHEDMKRLFEKVGSEDRPTTFLFADTQLKHGGFLEELNALLTSGEIPNLYGKDELPAIYDAVRNRCTSASPTPAELWSCFVESVRSNLHVVLCMSPVGSALRTRCRYYPGLVNGTTINYFHRWPADALTAVGIATISGVPQLSARAEPISAAFSTIHLSAQKASDSMLAELKRYNYITPTHFLELASTYKALLAEKSGEIGSSRDKLANGLAKLVEAGAGVKTMSAELEAKKVICAKSQKDCESLLVEIVSERRVADEQRKQVEADSERIAAEEVECQKIAADAQAGLDAALPALEKAMAEVDKLDKSSISEVKAYKAPPKAVETVLSAVMILFGKSTDWNTAKKVLGEANFLYSIKTYDKDAVSASTMKKLKPFVSAADFSPEAIGAVSRAAGALCVWVHAIHIYATVAKEVAPKRAALKTAQESLTLKQSALQKAQDDLAEVTAKVNKLKSKYDDSVNEKNRLRAEADNMQLLLERADKLVTGLAGENERWQLSIKSFEADLTKCVGDSLVASAFLSYAGPFDTSYRSKLVGEWFTAVKAAAPYSEDFQFASYCAKPTDVREWNINGLPADSNSTENGAIVTRCSRWPLCVDPQRQANKWIKASFEQQLRVVDLKSKDLLREIENGISFGTPVLLEDILEVLDPSLEPVLAKAVIKVGNRQVLRLGDKELDWSPDFRLFITTKLANPHFAPEVSTKTTIVNFAVRSEGLEAQLLSTVVRKEQPALERQNSDLTLRVAAGKKKLVDLEDEILRLLSETEGSLLENESLVDTLQQSKVTSDEVTKQLAEAEQTKKRIDAKREEYRPAAIRSSIAYFVLDDMSRVDPMYQFSLDAYVDLFNQSMEKSAKPTCTNGAERSKVISAYHTLAVYWYTCRGLFERHKLLFSLQLCFRIMGDAIPKAEFDFVCFGGGGAVIDRSDQRANPCSEWIDEATWDNVCQLDAAVLVGLCSSFAQNHREWRAWYMADKPEETPIPGDWENKVSELQRMCLVRALRLDRLMFAAAKFVALNLGPQFADPPPFDLKAIFETSTHKTPLIFILSPGVDPTAQVVGLAKELSTTVDVCALGQGQASVATNYISKGLKHGTWTFLANCHLMLSWMPELEKRIAEFDGDDTNTNFRLWLSASPSAQFPISILQRGVKMTTEPPRGLRANMLQLYNTVSEEQYDKCGQQFKYRRLLFCLAWFHACLLERRKFKNMGFNVPYEFNESDFSICHDLVIVFLDEYSSSSSSSSSHDDTTPFEAMRYLIAEANYGGRVTDALDRRLVNVYIEQFFCPDALNPDKKFSLAPQLGAQSPYFVPADASLAAAKEAAKRFPQADAAGAFGQHANADISSAREDSLCLLSTIISLQPKEVAATGGETDADRIVRTCQQMQIPNLFDSERVKRIVDPRSTDPEPLKTVLYQEVDRYDDLLRVLRLSLHDVELGVQGLVVVTPQLEQIIASLLDYKVPTAWSKCYPSLKPLAAWTRDLVARCDALSAWIDHELPKCFWLPKFTYPTGFLTALLQTTARKHSIAIDTLSWDFPVVNATPNAISQPPSDGAYVHGLYLEGARWDDTNSCLVEPTPMELISTMPVLHFKPTASKPEKEASFYACPLYMYPVRTGTRERPSFVILVDLKSGQEDEEVSGDYWTLRGTAMLLSTAF